MAANGASGGATHKFDPNFTKNVIAATGPKAAPRTRKVLGSLIQHLHDFARENEITVDEWMSAVEFINEAGQMSTDVRNEGQLVCDILGLESLVDEITYKLASDASDAPTATAILGPFWRKDAPKLSMGDSIIIKSSQDEEVTHMYGIVTDFKTGKPIGGAELDVWHTAPNGMYEQQDPEQPDFNLRGRFTTGKDGKYDFYCLKPTAYPIPDDGPAGRLLKMLDRHPMRPAHIHFIVSAPGYKPIVTQIFDRTDQYCGNDSVFAVKDSLIVDFMPLKDDKKAKFELPYDFRMASFEDAAKHSAIGSTEDSTA
ncbi:catechol 1,2-dioxygenase 1 [Tothia fuscella]|uniref:Catechol 1,2-dioxygenase 1 n=1 Tax=Tothia fuscella TaxID=1048955 RepID=A0A9P4NWR8_9PEZI|nr:catechol 1,2-dioxygenase 1 [Tothia fuscella]